MAEVEIKIGANTAALQRGLQDSQRLVAKFKGDASRMQMFESDNKVKRNLVGLATDLANVQNVAGLTSTVVGRLGEVFKTSLGAGLVIGLGAAFINMGQESAAAMKQLDERIAGVREGVKGLATKDLQGATAALRDFKQQVRELDKERKGRGFGDRVGDAMVGFGSLLTGGKFAVAADKRAEAEAVAQEATLKAQGAIVDRAREIADIADMRARGEYDAADALQQQLRFELEIQQAREAGIVEFGIDQIRRRQAAEATEREAKAQEKVAQDSERTRNAQVQIQMQRKQRALQALNEQVTEKLKTPQERAAERREEIKKERAERVLINRQLQKEDTDRRNAGLPGMDAKERQDRLRGQLDANKKARDPGAESLKNIEVILKDLREKVGVAV